MYASKATFAGQRASIGRNVIVGTPYGPVGGLITDIEDGDVVYIKTFTRDASPHGQRGYEFVERKTETEANALPPLTWSWLPRV